MIIDITINGEKRKVDFPLTWDKVTFRQLLGVRRAKNETDLISVFVGVPAEVLATAKISNLSAIKSMLQFIKTPIEYELPKEILGYKIKDNIEIEEITRYADMEAVLKTFGEDEVKNLETYPLIVATYVVEPYSYKDAENLAPAFLEAPAMEVLAVGNFIQTNIGVLNSIMPTILQLAASPRTNWRQGLRNSIRRLVFTLFWFLLKRRFPSPVRRYLSGRLRSLSLTYGL